MKLVVWIPGILGSRLVRRGSGAVVWPPGPASENLFEDRTFDQLTSPDLTQGGIIDAVALCCAVYQPVDDLFAAAGFVTAMAGATAPLQCLTFAFDWRLDLTTTAKILAAQLNTLAANATEITFLGHSMGALLSRYMLEAKSLEGAPFRKKVTRLISMNGPQVGAAVMAARALGIEQTEFIAPADGRRVIAAPGYSGGMDLLPQPGQAAVFNGAIQIDLFDPYYAKAFQLGPNIDAAKAFWADLKAGSRAPGVQYVIAHSLVDGKQTPSVLRYKTAWTVEMDTGDGTVTSASATAVKGDLVITLPGTHLGGLQTDEFRDQLFSLYISRPAVDERFMHTVPRVHLQAVRPSVEAREKMMFALVSHPDKAKHAGELAWFEVDAAGRPRSAVARTPVTIPAGTTPTFSAEAPMKPGLYRVVLTLPDDDAALLSPLTTNIQVRPARGEAPAPPAPVDPAPAR